MSIIHNGAVNVLEQAVLPAGELGYFVFHPGALAPALQRIGFSVSFSERTSYSGIPLYELTAHSRPCSAPIDGSVIREHLSTAIRETLSLNADQYRDALERKGTATEVAFFAFNIANGALRLKDLGQGYPTPDESMRGNRPPVSGFSEL